MDLSPLSKIQSFGAPTLEDFDTDNIQDGKRIGGKSNRQFVRFYNRTESEVKATKVHVNPNTGETRVLETKPFPVTREFVQIVTPGDKNEVDQPAETFHKREHFRAYRAFREGRTAPLGRAIDECSYVSQSIATELKIHQCYTEEQLADASDLLCNQIPDGFSLREFARSACKARLDSAQGGRVAVLTSQLEESQKMIAELQEQMKSLLVDASGEPIKRSPGRPKKTEELTVTE